MGRRDQKPGLVACPKPVLVKHDLAGWVTLASESEAGDCKLKASLGYIMTLLSKKSKSWEYNSVVGHMPRMCNSVGSVSRVADRKTNKQKTKLLETKLKITKQNPKQLSNLNFAIKKKKKPSRTTTTKLLMIPHSFFLHLPTSQQIFILSFTFLTLIRIQIPWEEESQKKLILNTFSSQAPWLIDITHHGKEDSYFT